MTTTIFTYCVFPNIYMLICGLISTRFYLNTLTLKPCFEPYKKFYYLCSLSPIIFIIFFIKRTSILCHILFLLCMCLPAYLFFEENKLNRLLISFFNILFYFLSELIPSQFYVFLRLFRTHQNISPAIILQSGKIGITLLNLGISVCIFWFLHILFFKIYKTYLLYSETKTLIYISLPFIVLIFNSILISLFPEKEYWYCILFLWITLAASIRFFIQGLFLFENQQHSQLQDLEQSVRLTEELNTSSALLDTYRQYRKWSHDFSNHMTVLHHLTDHKNMDELQTYVDHMIQMITDNKTEEDLDVQ